MTIHRWRGQQPKATAEQALEIARRGRLFRENRPAVVAREMGLDARYVAALMRCPPKRYLRSL